MSRNRKRPVFCRGGGRRGARILGGFPSCTRALRTRVGTQSHTVAKVWGECGGGRPNQGRRTCAKVPRVFNVCRCLQRRAALGEAGESYHSPSPTVGIPKRPGLGPIPAMQTTEHAFLPDDGGFECIFCGRTASEHQKASGGSYESTKPAERDLEMEDEDDWDAIQEELRRLTRRCRQARAAARSSQPTHPRASPAWLSRLRKRRPERRPSCSSQK